MACLPSTFSSDSSDQQFNNFARPSSPSMEPTAPHSHHIFNPGNYPPNQDGQTNGSYHRARRPALVPHTASLSLEDASDMVRSRIGQPLIPPPDPRLFAEGHRDNTDGTSKRNPTCQELNMDKKRAPSPTSVPPPVEEETQPASDIRGDGYLCRPEYVWAEDDEHSPTSPRWPVVQLPSTTSRGLMTADTDFHSHPQKGAEFTAVTPKRKHSVFLLDEERRSIEGAVADTMHLSEVESDEDDELKTSV